jgi:L-threonylcarbamoyladenylate synthase
LRRRLVAHVRKGGVIAYATASCFGLGCDPRNARAAKAILRLKRRPQAKGLILIASRYRQLKPYVRPPSPEEGARMAATWPGPHTWIVPALGNTPRWLTGGRDTLAVRVDAHPDAVVVCEALGMAIVSTSANVSGSRPVRTTRECLRQFGASVLVVPGRIGRDRRPSTIHDLQSGRILRK